MLTDSGYPACGQISSALSLAPGHCHFCENKEDLVHWFLAHSGF